MNIRVHFTIETTEKPLKIFFLINSKLTYKHLKSGETNIKIQTSQGSTACAVIRGIPRAVGGLRCSSPHLAETAEPAQETAGEPKHPNTGREREKGEGAWLTSLTLLIMLFRSCSSFSLFCWLVWWMICCQRKQSSHPDAPNTEPSLRGRLTAVMLSPHTLYLRVFSPVPAV